MAIIVDKVQKRKDIALSCVELFIQSGINDLTISQVAKSAGVGKGTFYEYFKNKEDIVFEIVTILMQRHNERKKEKLSHAASTKEKIICFFDFFYNPEDSDLREIYKEFVAINMSTQNQEMIAFQTECHQSYLRWVDEIIQEGIAKGEISQDSTKLIQALFSMSTGIFIHSLTTNNITDVQGELANYIDALFNVIQRS